MNLDGVEGAMEQIEGSDVGLALDLIHDGVDVVEVGLVEIGDGTAAPDHSIEFFMDFLLHLLFHGQVNHRPGESRCRSLQATRPNIEGSRD